MDKNTIKQRVRAKFNGMKFRGTSDMTCSAIDERHVCVLAWIIGNSTCRDRAGLQS